MKKSAFFIFAILFISNNLFGQDPNNNITPNEKIFPPSPTASSLGKYGETPVSYYTGGLHNFVYIFKKNI